MENQEIMNNEMNEVEIQEAETPEIIPAEEADGSTSISTSAVAAVAAVAVGIGAGVTLLAQNVIVPGVKKIYQTIKKRSDNGKLNRAEKKAEKQRRKDAQEFNDEPIEGVEDIDE